MQPFVLQVVSSLSPGGAERFVIELASRLPNYGYRTKLIVLFGSGPLQELVRERNLHWLQMGDSSGINRLTLIARLRRMIHEDVSRRPAIVHTHLFGADVWGAFSQWGVPRQARPRFVSTAHNVDTDDPVWRRLFRRAAVPVFDRVVSVSDEVKRYTIKTLGVSPTRAMTIDGMCLIQPPLRPQTGFHRPPRLVTVARLVPQKGIETALRALADVPPPWHYTILGAGPLERELKELSERLGIASRVEFAGVSMRIPEILPASDLFLFPSRWEGLGSAALEAAWAGVPVLVSDIDPLRSVFPAEQRIAIDDVPAWTRAIMSVLGDPNHSVISAAELAPSIAARFHPEIVAQKYAELYDELLKHKI
jgi:glycosyltransferase involved in cell wall biosynthesis